MIRDVPLAVHSDQAKESDEGMSHQSNATALWSAVEEGDLSFAVLEGVGKMHGGLPCVRMHRGLIVCDPREVCSAVHVDADFVAMLHH
jgi:hypothetical protein